MRANGTFSRSNNVDGRKGLIPIRYALRLALFQLMTVGVEYALGQCLRMKLGDHMRCDERVKASMEGTSLSSVLQGSHEPRLILDGWMIQVNLG